MVAAGGGGRVEMMRIQCTHVWNSPTIFKEKKHKKRMESNFKAQKKVFQTIQSSLLFKCKTNCSFQPLSSNTILLVKLHPMFSCLLFSLVLFRAQIDS